MIIDLNTAVSRLQSFDDVLILMHHSPDGDTIGGSFALCRALQRLGRRAAVMCDDELSDKYSYIYKGIERQQFTPRHIVAVDVADAKLLGSLRGLYGDRVELCIDHHATNTQYAAETYVDPSAAAACESVYEIIRALGLEVDCDTANALYTGIATDTGCFKFTNTTPKTHRIAAELFETGINYGEINRIMFDTKSKSRLAVEQMALGGMEFYHKDTIAAVAITADMIKTSRARECELDGITSLPRMIEGVIVGITLRQRGEDTYKISVRTHAPVSACALCAAFDGGGHERAAGCEISGSLPEVKAAIVARAEEMMNALGV